MTSEMNAFPVPSVLAVENNDEIENMLLSILSKNTQKVSEVPKEGELNISVKTACCYIDRPYNIKKMCVKIEDLLKNYNTITADGERKGPYTPIKSINYTKVDNPDNLEEGGILVKNSKANNNFYNSICISVKIRQEKCINLMIFTNGKITCTGSKNDDDGLVATNMLLEEMKKFPDIFENEDDRISSRVVNYEVVMINSNFFAGFFIDNRKLYNLLMDNRDTYKLFSSFDPRVYQGVKIYFMWNKNQVEKNGICCCQKKCKYGAKKKGGNGEGDCRRISVAVFGTGKVLIAGAKNNEQLQDTFQFILKLLQDNYQNIVQYSIEDKKKLFKDFVDIKKGTVVKKLKVLV